MKMSWAGPALVVVCIPILQGALAEVEATLPLLGSNRVFVAGAGHSIFEANRDFTFLGMGAVAPEEGSWYAAILSPRDRPAARFYVEGPDTLFPFPGYTETLDAGTYDLYIVGPGAAAFVLDLRTDLPGGDDADATAWWGEIREMTGPFQWVDVGLAEPTVPAAVLRVPLRIPDRSMIFSFESMHLTGTGAPGGVVGTSVHRLLSPDLQQSCLSVAMYSVGGLAPGTAAFGVGGVQAVSPGPWQVGVDFAAATNMLLRSHRAVAVATSISDQDPTLAVSDISYTLTQLGVPDVVHAPAEQVACSGVWNPLEPPLADYLPVQPPSP